MLYISTGKGKKQINKPQIKIIHGAWCVLCKDKQLKEQELKYSAFAFVWVVRTVPRMLKELESFLSLNGITN